MTTYLIPDFGALSAAATGMAIKAHTFLSCSNSRWLELLGHPIQKQDRPMVLVWAFRAVSSPSFTLLNYCALARCGNAVKSRHSP